MKIILLRALTALIVTLALALAYPFFANLGLIDDAFVASSVLIGSVLVWITLEVLEKKLKV